MNNLFNWFITGIGAIISIAIGIGVYQLFAGNYFELAPLMGAFLVLVSVAVVTCIIVSLVKLHKTNVTGVLILFAFAGLVSSCDYAKPNQQILVSSDCGVNWKLVDTGQLVPKGGMNYCFIKVAVPAASMQGESEFIANFAHRVRATVQLGFDYNITDPILYIRSAKYLGRANTDSDSSTNDAEIFEKLENKMIDSRVREATKQAMLNEDVSEYDQADLEDKILNAVNEITEKIGIHINYLSSSFLFEEQTAQAIDAVVAMKIYESKGMTDVGKALMSARASSTKITVEGTKVTIPEE